MVLAANVFPPMVTDQGVLSYRPTSPSPRVREAEGRGGGGASVSFSLVHGRSEERSMAG